MTKVARWGWVITLVTLTGVVGVLGFLLSVGTTSERGFFERHYNWLFWVNVGVAVVLTLVILTAAVRLFVRVRQGRFGSRLLFKLAAIFALVGGIAGLAGQVPHHRVERAAAEVQARSTRWWGT